MKLRSDSFADGGRIPGEFAFAVIDRAHRIRLSANRNPHLAWSEAPAGTKSFALICHDRDVPSKPDDVNQEGREVPSSLPRVDFFHWVLVDIAASTTEIDTGAYSHEVTPRGKGGPAAPHGTRQGLNDYTRWFSGDHDMEGDYYGYDGPCPPWNDSLVHHYVFTVFALDIDAVPLDGRFSGADARRAIDGHVLASASITGTYSLNPRLAGQEG
ncbi:MAG: YbhB/YbcL family Raf kinase inhibitor-like protein [Burkholderiales bacterium]|nr:MAG: YbhB/YbcL family Raf kinase inhibitor-like protein [Burkholderiales bacterium]